jgi:hypothetical protein
MTQAFGMLGRGLVAVALLGGVFVGAAQAQKAPSGDSLSVLQEFLPLDQPQHRLKIPSLDETGNLKSVIESLTVTRVDEKNLKLEELVISMYTESGEIEFVVESPFAMFDTESKVLSSDQRTTITHDDFVMVGDGMLFHTETRQGKMTGSVVTEVRGGVEFSSPKREKEKDVEAEETKDSQEEAKDEDE